MFAFDNIRWRVQTKIWGGNTNLEYTQKSVRVFTRADFARLGVVAEKCWEKGPTREQVAGTHHILKRLSTQSACQHLVTKENAKLQLALALQGRVIIRKGGNAEEPLLSRADPRQRADDDPMLDYDEDD